MRRRDDEKGGRCLWLGVLLSSEVAWRSWFREIGDLESMNDGPWQVYTSVDFRSDVENPDIREQLS